MNYLKLNRFMLIIAVAVIAVPLMALLAKPVSADAVYQYSVPAPTLAGRRAFLWIPQHCKRVRGLVIAAQNMLERPLFARPAFRATLAKNDLGELLIFPGHDSGPDDNKMQPPPNRSSLDIFLNPHYPNGQEDPQAAGRDLQNILDELAVKSGYSELRNVPLMPVGHSSAGSFVWHLCRWDPSRFFALLPFKTGVKDDGPSGIPVLMIDSEWFDYGPDSNNVWSKGAVSGRNNGACLFGYYVDFGSGHQNVSDDSLKVVSLFIDAAVAERIPAHAPLNGPVALKPVTEQSGWLLNPATIGQPGDIPVPYADYTGNKAQAYWYMDKQLADYVQDHMAAQMAKKPQQINFYTQGNPPPVTGGTYVLSPHFLSDGATFRVHATYISSLTRSDLFPPGTTLTNSGMPIYYRITSGGLVQVGPDTFRVCPHAGPIIPQGNPWQPTILAYTLGNNEYQPTERPMHVNINIMNPQGAPQTISFPQTPNQSVHNHGLIPLRATASSGLPVQYIVVSGPVMLAPDGKSLELLPIPPRSKFPVPVLIQAFQWGRPNAPQIQSVETDIQRFYIER